MSVWRFHKIDFFLHFPKVQYSRSILWEFHEDLSIIYEDIWFKVKPLRAYRNQVGNGSWALGLSLNAFFSEESFQSPWSLELWIALSDHYQISTSYSRYSFRAGGRKIFFFNKYFLFYNQETTIFLVEKRNFLFKSSPFCKKSIFLYFLRPFAHKCCLLKKTFDFFVSDNPVLWSDDHRKLSFFFTQRLTITRLVMDILSWNFYCNFFKYVLFKCHNIFYKINKHSFKKKSQKIVFFLTIDMSP